MIPCPCCLDNNWFVKEATVKMERLYPKDPPHAFYLCPGCVTFVEMIATKYGCRVRKARS
jgi:hypothetical protein